MYIIHSIHQAQWHSSPTLSREVLEFFGHTRFNIWWKDLRLMNCVHISTGYHLKQKVKCRNRGYEYN
jgi:hypothetical protein